MDLILKSELGSRGEGNSGERGELGKSASLPFMTSLATSMEELHLDFYGAASKAVSRSMKPILLWLNISRNECGSSLHPWFPIRQQLCNYRIISRCSNYTSVVGNDHDALQIRFYTCASMGEIYCNTVYRVSSKN